ncbi:hypothetical protein GUJ93_ZPchr0002g26194 [Zizania palustris]|uniref:Uncharacterized protein n=1 Tax=Zizania palustris TaxID=103762 RepID=A0A8J5S5X2_ZIZPA|nr:hypothetical protein GUJ93_ZPchr0002g26194 [Zizania palustris]
MNEVQASEEVIVAVERVMRPPTPDEQSQRLALVRSWEWNIWVWTWLGIEGVQDLLQVMDPAPSNEGPKQKWDLMQWGSCHRALRSKGDL